MFAYPTDAPTSSRFGWRVHPILGYRRFHAGQDFAASYGSTIRAADSGTVILLAGTVVMVKLRLLTTATV